MPMDKQTLITRIKGNPLLRPLANVAISGLKTWYNFIDKRHPIRHAYRQYARYYGKRLNLENPRTLYDKIFYREYFTDVNSWRQCTDKVQVRQYLKSKGLEEYLIPVHHIFEETPGYEEFVAALPEQCVVKTAHSGGGEGVVIIKDKSRTNLRKVYKTIVRSTHDAYGRRTGSPHYFDIKPRIIVEKLLVDPQHPQYGLDDYKLFCLNGQPVCINAICERNLDTHAMVDKYFDLDMKLYPWKPQLDNAQVLTPPTKLAQMVDLARKLSADFDFVRVDLYQVGDRIYFGELTFTPGLDFFIADYGEKILHLGDRLDISAAKPLDKPLID